jgi:hypothetical protein
MKTLVGEAGKAVRLDNGFPQRGHGWRHVGFVVDKASLGQVSSEYSYLSCQSSRRLLHTHHPSSGTGSIGPVAADVPSGLSSTPPQESTNI